jgi:DNA-binding NarL/FixJ family response regulator
VLWLALRAEVCAGLDDAQAAPTLYEQLLPHAQLHVARGMSYWGPATYYLGLLAATLRRWEAAEQHFSMAVAMTERLNAKPFLAHVRHAYGAVLLARRQGDGPARALPLLAEAAALYDELGMAHDAAQTRALLAEVASAGSAAGVAYPDGLSEREAEVLRLVAAGKSNRDIAERLVISVNTVFQHVRSILNKTGCSNRTEAAAYALRHGLVE